MNYSSTAGRCRPFMGVGSEVHGAVINGRKGVGVELKTAYYRQALLNLQSASSSAPAEQGDLFACLDDAPIEDAPDADLRRDFLENLP